MGFEDEQIVEYLAACPAKAVVNKDTPDERTHFVGRLTFRMSQEDWRATSFLLTHGQLIRLRNDINRMLHDPDCWLYTPGDETHGRRAITPEGFDCETTDFESPADPRT